MPPEANPRLAEVQTLLSHFKLERYAYICINVLSLVIIIVCAVALFIQGKWELSIGVLGGSGGVVFTSSRLLKMWSDALHYLGDKPREEE